MTTSGEASTTINARSVSMIAAWYGLTVLIVVTIFAAIDRQILLLVTEPLKHALGLSDTQIGTLNGIALSLVALLATFPLGWLADRVNRKVLLAVFVLIWSASTAACGFAQTFGQLFACGVGIAVGEAILGPIVYAFIPDLFPRDRWILANYVFYLAGVVGSALGLSLSGWVIGLTANLHASLPSSVSNMDGWRLALIAVAAPGPIIALMILAIRSSQRRGAPQSEQAPSFLNYIREHLRTFIGIFCGFGLAATAFGTNAVWTPIALVRLFGQTPAQTGVKLGIVTAAASLTGVLVSGFMVRVLRRRWGDNTALRVAQIGVVAALLLTPLYLVSTSAWQVFVLAFFQMAFMTCTLSLSPSILQFMTPGNMRGRVIALGGLFYVVCQSISPVLVGAASDHLSVGPRGLLLAMAAVSIPGFIIAALLLRLAEKTLSATITAAALEA